MRKASVFLMLFLLFWTTACSVHTNQENNHSIAPPEPGEIPMTVYSDRIGEVNGVAYHVPVVSKQSFWMGKDQKYKVPTCELFPIKPKEGMVIPSFCYYDEYVYYVECENKSKRYDTYLYRCKPDWTEVELVDELLNHSEEEEELGYDFSSSFFIIHDGKLFYSSYLIDRGEIFAIDLSTLQRVPADPVFFTAKERESYPNPLEYPVSIYNDMVFYRDDNELYRETMAEDTLLSDNSPVPLGCANGYLYYQVSCKILPDIVMLCRMPVEGGKKEFLAIRKVSENGAGFFG